MFQKNVLPGRAFFYALRAGGFLAEILFGELFLFARWDTFSRLQFIKGPDKLSHRLAGGGWTVIRERVLL
jgi:hypothetical protein